MTPVTSDLGNLVSSPVHRAVWDERVPVELFDSRNVEASATVRSAMARSLAAVRRHKEAGTAYDACGEIAPELIAELGQAGYWGLAAGLDLGGAGAPFSLLASSITEMALLDGWVAGLASCHAAIGPVETLEAFGTPDQRTRLLPALVRGERLGAFAVTEPGAGSDLSRVHTTAVRAGGDLVITGEKLFITNGAPGRTVSVLCRVDDRFELVIAELPFEEDDRFRTIRYPLRAQVHMGNRGLVFDGLRVPAANLVQAPRGDGRALAYHALNRGRVAVGANAAAMLRLMIGSLVPWVQQRVTFGEVIASRELVRGRLGRLAARVTACDALVAWAAQLLDEGYRGELESVIVKVFASEILKEATVDLLLKTHGGRALLEGNLFADTLYDLLAPTVYEGENEILTLGFFGTLSRVHRETLLEPLAAAIGSHPRTLRHQTRSLWTARHTLAAYARWLGGRRRLPELPASRRRLQTDPDALTAAAVREIREVGLDISRAVRRHGAAILQRQAVAFDLARRAQLATAMLVTSRYAARQPEPLTRLAAICMAMELGQQVTGAQPSAEYYRALGEVGAAVSEERFLPAAGVERGQTRMVEHLEAVGPRP